MFTVVIGNKTFEAKGRIVLEGSQFLVALADRKI